MKTEIDNLVDESVRMNEVDDLFMDVLDKVGEYISLKEEVNPFVQSLDNGVENAYLELKQSFEQLEKELEKFEDSEEVSIDNQ